ncbi:Dienelactone hydrolase family protein [Mariniphaga anaerophila]|uniref:Dienelactone hydrolase family protein n=1 Tax=Mariniphaga anaerophila TaxID=1484053 RepID=A0A1M5DCP6_9BACT|nr:sialidase [Mariniphaga anaerophila]SHF64737.1 Dienelactone hydrolase family protein [Mariniphaga anaerophila]
MKLSLITAIIILTFRATPVFSQCVKNQEKEVLWEQIEQYFSPPEAFRNALGNFRSPLKFYNGDTVQSAEEWRRRREEIAQRWHEMMGSWPPIISNQKLEITETIQRENFTQHKVRFYWLPEEQTEGYLLIPNGKGAKPAVITVFYEPETAIGMGKPHRDFAYQLAKRGFVVLSLGTTETTQAKTYSLYYPSIENASVQPLSTLAYAAANAWNVLAKVNGIDSTRIGILGHSYGGKWAMFASCLYEKFACAAWSDPGIVFDETKGSGVNYWEPWYLGYFQPPWTNIWRKKGMVEEAKGLYPKLIKGGYNLHELHALMAPRPFLVSGGSSDPPERWEALNHTIAVNKLLGYSNRVAMTNRPEHSPNEESNEQIYRFFEYFLGE